MTKRRKKLTYLKYGNRCYICSIILTKESRTIDHIRPVVAGGTNEEKNLRPCCHSCNQEKGGKRLEKYIRQFITYKAIDLLPKGVRIPLSIYD